MKNIDENAGTRHKDYWTKKYTRSEDNIRSLTESTCISVESLEDGTFYEDDNDEFVATLSEMSDCHVGQNCSDDELLDEYCRESELRYKTDSSWMFLITRDCRMSRKKKSEDSRESMDDTIARVMTNLEQFKLQRQLERRRRERLKCLHLVLAVVMILLLAALGVGLRVGERRVRLTGLSSAHFLDSDVNKAISSTCEG